MVDRKDAGTLRPPRRGHTGAGDRRKTVKIDRVPVRSTNLVSVGYDDKSCILEIEFKDGRVYRYSGVPQKEHRSLMAASSHGKYFVANVRDKYGCTKVAGPGRGGSRRRTAQAGPSKSL